MNEDLPRGRHWLDYIPVLFVIGGLLTIFWTVSATNTRVDEFTRQTTEWNQRQDKRLDSLETRYEIQHDSIEGVRSDLRVLADAERRREGLK